MVILRFLMLLFCINLDIRGIDAHICLFHFELRDMALKSEAFLDYKLRHIRYERMSHRGGVD